MSILSNISSYLSAGQSESDVSDADRSMCALPGKRFFLALCAGLISIFIFSDAKAQTCRVSLGVCNGHQSFMEVYEYDYVSEKPCFPGGDNQLISFINKNRNYPREAYNKGIQGRVTCSFIVNADGSVSHVTVLKSVEESLNQEAMRILNLMPNWIPGRIDGHAVPVRVIRCIPFRK